MDERPHTRIRLDYPSNMDHIQGSRSALEAREMNNMGVEKEADKRAAVESGKLQPHAVPAVILASDEPASTFKLPTSKTPIVDALCFCALKGWGIYISRNERVPHYNPLYRDVLEFMVTDFEKLDRISRRICPKGNPTSDPGARIKTFRRWFTNFPQRDVVLAGQQFPLTVKPGQQTKKMKTIIEQMERLIARQQATYI